MTHRRSDERIRIEALVAYSTVKCSQTRRDGRSFRAPLAASAALPWRTDPTLLSVAARCLGAARHRQPRTTGSCGPIDTA